MDFSEVSFTTMKKERLFFGIRRLFQLNAGCFSAFKVLLFPSEGPRWCPPFLGGGGRRYSYRVRNVSSFNQIDILLV